MVTKKKATRPKRPVTGKPKRPKRVMHGRGRRVIKRTVAGRRPAESGAKLANSIKKQAADIQAAARVSGGGGKAIAALIGAIALGAVGGRLHANRNRAQRISNQNRLTMGQINSQP